MHNKIKRIIKIGFFITVVCIFTRLFIGEPCYVPSASMEPTLNAGDWLWINKMSYGAQLPIRFADIPLVNVFTWFNSLRMADQDINWGHNRLKGWKEPSVGDIVVFRSLENRNILLIKRIVKKLDTLPPCYYMLGDNRNNSFDSRMFGYIPKSAIIGKVNLVLISHKDFHRIFKIAQ